MAGYHTPLIGVTGPASRAGYPAWWFTRFALRRAGARVCRITPSSARLPKRLDGLVIGGGDDIDPSRYGEAPRLTVKLDPKRDELEWRMLEMAAAEAFPVLGICRGSQLMNVFYGGNLHQDLTEVFTQLVLKRTVLPRKRIHIEKGSKLRGIMDSDSAFANSLHHQAVARLAPGFQVGARDADGIVQAIEASDQRFLLGVQWHPEYLPQRRRHRRIFKALVQAARDRLTNR